ncbi:uncharacterized protein RCC_08961 [Ramularia collo-cygni]|uniref:Uncharacterized protein n=1 Tax=Ramularia collo-cygni TaxID=112498 RepID=A0A2D3V8K4_9PEZI|nr:uncharacterized protein RCC_08961 [Ramularia collo-cygni]CZT23250.1 uncharacterized protein RCC_08961 [Ramularia collo-cygni]
MQSYRHFEQTQGELCSLPGTIYRISYKAVGTYRCRTCMCIYVKFKDDSVFIVHIIAQNMTTPEQLSTLSGEEKYDVVWTFGQEKGGKLKQSVYEQPVSQLGEGRRDQAVTMLDFLKDEKQWRDGLYTMDERSDR